MIEKYTNTILAGFGAVIWALLLGAVIGSTVSDIRGGFGPFPGVIVVLTICALPFYVLFLRAVVRRRK